MSNRKPRAMASIKLALPIMAALALAGCVSLGPDLPDTLIDLSPSQSAPAGATGSGTLADAVVILEPEAAQRLSVLRVAVQVDAANVAYLKDATWVERPTRLFQRLLAETVRARGGHLVIDSDVGARGAQRISGQLLDMGYDARSQSVVVRFDAHRTLRTGQIEQRRFEANVPGVRPKAPAVAAALNEAANAVAGQVADWIG